jgi:hypothetical protein
MNTHRSGDCAIAILGQPDVALSLTCTDNGAWRSMIFEFATKKVVYADEKLGRLSDVQQHLVKRVADLYGTSLPDVKWRQSFTARGDGPNG